MISKRVQNNAVFQTATSISTGLAELQDGFGKFGSVYG